MLVETIKPDPDSQYRLVPCECGGEPVYRHFIGEAIPVDHWDAYCPTCENQTEFFHKCQHDAQIAWNTGKVKNKY